MPGHEESVTCFSVVYQHEGQIYRVLYQPSEHSYMLTKPVVHQLNLEINSDGLQMSLGEEIPQDWIPENCLNGF